MFTCQHILLKIFCCKVMATIKNLLVSHSINKGDCVISIELLDTIVVSIEQLQNVLNLQSFMRGFTVWQV